MDHEALALRRSGPADAAAIAAIHVAAWREAYPGLMPESMIAARTVADRTRLWRRVLADPADAVFLALRAGRPCGFVAAGTQRDAGLAARGFAGEITALYVLAADQRRGVGRALMAAAARRLAEAGHRSAALWVLEANAPARAFYRRLGGAELAAREEVEPEAVIREVAYGWTDLNRLAAAGTPAPTPG